MKNSKPQLKIQNFLVLAILFLLPVYLIKIKLGWMSFNALELLIGILFLVWIFGKQAKYNILNTKYKIPIVLMFSGLFLSVIANKNYYVGLGVVKGWFVFPIIFAIIFYDALKKDDSLLKKSLLALFFSGAVISAIGIFYKLFGILTYDGRLKTFWDSPNQLAMFLAVPLLAGFLRLNLKNYYQRLGVALIGINLYLTKSYGAWLALAIALLVIFWLKYNKKEHKKYLAIFAMLLVIFLVWASISKYKNIENLGTRSSFASRVTIWKSAGLMVEKNPIFGIGPGNFQEKYLEYQKYFPPYLEWSAPQPHNIFLAFWLQSGLIGLIGFVWLLILFFRDNKKTIKNDRDLGILFLAIMTYTLVHGLVDTTYWRNDLAVVFWVAAAANTFLIKEKSI